MPELGALSVAIATLGTLGSTQGSESPPPVLRQWSLVGVNFEAVDSANPVAMTSRSRVIRR